jgi:hypothetical protein
METTRLGGRADETHPLGDAGWVRLAVAGAARQDRARCGQVEIFSIVGRGPHAGGEHRSRQGGTPFLITTAVDAGVHARVPAGLTSSGFVFAAGCTGSGSVTGGGGRE